MKNIFNIKNTFTGFFIIMGLMSCKSQTIYSLNSSEIDAPTNSYFKDLNNELDQYIGTWTATHQGNTITLVISKELKRSYELLNNNYFKDALIVKYEVKNSSGNILQSTLNNNYNVGGEIKNMIMSLGTNLSNNNEVNLLYTGGNCSVGNGFIYFEQINTTQFSWKYEPGGATLNDIDCPPNKDYNIYIPIAENLVFTKQ